MVSDLVDSQYSTMNPSVQLVFNEIRRTFAEIHRKFDESYARWDRLFIEFLTALEQ